MFREQLEHLDGHSGRDSIVTEFLGTRTFVSEVVCRAGQ